MEEDAHIESAPAALQTNDQKHLKEFILVLETLPEIWDSSNANIINKVKRANAYEQLLEIFRKIKPGATAKDVIAKINSLKSNYRKELKKITDSKRSGAAAENVYNPKSWVFHMLKFLNKNEKPIDRSEFSELVKSENEEEQSEPSFSSMGVPAPPSKKLKKKGPIARQNDLLEKAFNYLSQSSHQSESPSVSFPNIDPTAVYWAHKLNKLMPTQRLLAEKAINEILFEAELGTLNRDSVQINTSPQVFNRFVSQTSNSHPSPSP
ncbi:uncharacterized protein LOC125050715 [Pieris napi]|uniref:uncharacterized protein LOC125050715 n=1 Tax=Pieris napi TaxID=78633 RepID=UPI001FB9AC8E|nr:uncharacterized protein LOC125050715 [Pieris napi]